MAMALSAYIRKAYAAAAAMLAEKGRAAVMHPNGTERSFIGFQLCAEHPGQQILWISPSAGIFRRQSENWTAAGGGTLKNIVFLTYAKLADMTEKQNAEMHPDYIVLDELCCESAEIWGRAWSRLLAAHGDTPMLGLSAADLCGSLHDPANGSFDGCIASKMTLGEAVVCGSMTPPLLTVSACFGQDDLKQYAQRVRRTESSMVRETAAAGLETLRRVLEQSGAPDAVFVRHMPERHGKYIVFAPDAASVQKAVKQAAGWFGKLDGKMHIYSVCADDPSVSKSLCDFNTDDSDHLRILYCIDALGGCVRADDVSGVILLRTAASYCSAQAQISAALSVSDRQLPVLFDMVSSMEICSSTDVLRDEMRSAVSDLRTHGGEAQIMHESFAAADGLAECRKLLIQLENTLSASWGAMYSAAERYYKVHGSLQMPDDYCTAEGDRLGAWLSVQRRADGQMLTGAQIEKLDRLGMIWDVSDYVFERNFHSAVSYYREHGDLECSADYADSAGVRLGAWLKFLRSQYKKNGHSPLTESQLRLMNAIGMRWGGKFDQQWDDYYKCLRSYLARTGNTDVPSTWKEGDVLLGRWFRSQKEQYVSGKLRQDRADRLLALGLDLMIGDSWEEKFLLAKKYSEEHGGSLLVPYDYIAEGVWLNKWLNEQRLLGEGKRRKKLTDVQRQKLESIGMVFGQTNVEQAWEKHYQAVSAYVARTGSTAIPKDMRDESAFLKNWVDRQLAVLRKGKLPPEKAEKLKALGFVCHETDSFDAGFAHARLFYEEFGHLHTAKAYVCSDGYKLSAWLADMRQKRKHGRLSAEQIRQLDAIGMVWNSAEAAWDEMFDEAKRYAAAGKPLRIPTHQRAPNGQDLYDWYLRQRKLYASGRLPEDKVQKLLSIGAVLEIKARKKRSV